METNKTSWPILTFSVHAKSINPRPIYQRGEVWNLKQKQLLIDSILKNLDIPKIYLRKIISNKRKRYQYEIIDGQQRILALLDFIGAKYPLLNDAEPIQLNYKSYDIAGKYYTKPKRIKEYRILSPEVIHDKFDPYNLDIIIVSNANDAQIAELFFRLNNGKPLTYAEIRNSIIGKLTLYVKKLTEMHFLQKVRFKNRRFAHDETIAQTILLEFNNGITDISNKFLTEMYKSYKHGIPKKYKNKIEKVYKILDTIFPSKSKFLNKVSVINLYLLVSYLIVTTNFRRNNYKKFHSWYIKSELKRQKDPDYKAMISRSTDSKVSIQNRFRYLLLDFSRNFKRLGIVNLDPKRIFDDEQKKLIYAKNKGICQNCKKPVNEDKWHADHIKPWIKGGRTIVKNGQVLCISCNLKKKDKLW